MRTYSGLSSCSGTDTADLVMIFCELSYKPNKKNGFQRTIPSTNSDLYLETSEKYLKN